MSTETLLPEKRLCGGCLDCSRLVIWRGDGSDRRMWKSFCTLCLIGELSVYLYVVQSRPLLVVMGLVTLAKLLVETWGQDTPTWVCPGGPVLFFLIYFLIIPGIVYADGLCTKNPDIIFPCKDAVGFALFLFGYSYSLWYEVNRFKWKKDPSNKGRLHAIGLAKYCTHPNYLGDLFCYTGWGICAGTTCSLSAPAAMIPSFVYLVIPNSDAYLADKYSDEWPAYEAKTARLIPYLQSGAGNHALAIIALLLSCYLGQHCGEQCGW